MDTNKQHIMFSGLPLQKFQNECHQTTMNNILLTTSTNSIILSFEMYHRRTLYLLQKCLLILHLILTTLDDNHNIHVLFSGNLIYAYERVFTYQTCIGIINY